MAGGRQPNLPDREITVRVAHAQIYHWIVLKWFIAVAWYRQQTGLLRPQRESQFTAIPPFVSSGAPPLVMLAMGRDHKLYYEAYNDASDLNDDGKLDIHYAPQNIPATSTTPVTKGIDYYGYFDSYKCYAYNSAQARFNPTCKNCG